MRRPIVLASGALAFAVCVLGPVLAGCGRTYLQREVLAAGAPPHADGRAVVILPRTCIASRRVAPDHVSPHRAGAKATEKVRRALDHMVAGAARADVDPGEACTPLPDFTQGAASLVDLRASAETVRLMRDRKAELAVVLEVHTSLVCAYATGDLVGVEPVGTSSGRSWSELDGCDDEDTELHAFVFRDDGSAMWVGTRDIVPGEAAEDAVERLLQRIPVTIPTRASRTATADVRCRVDDRGVADCT